MRVNSEKILAVFAQVYESAKAAPKNLQKLFSQMILFMKATGPSDAKKFTVKKKTEGISINPIDIQKEPPTFSYEGAGGKLLSHCKGTLMSGISDEKIRALKNFEVLLNQDFSPPEFTKTACKDLLEVFKDDLKYLPKTTQNALDEVKYYAGIPRNPRIYP